MEREDKTNVSYARKLDSEDPLAKFLFEVLDDIRKLPLQDGNVSSEAAGHRRS
jgi:hypothetical protein